MATRRPPPKEASPQDLGSRHPYLAHLTRPRLTLTGFFSLPSYFFFHLPAALCVPDFQIIFQFPVTKVTKGGQLFAQSPSRPALSSIRSASVDRRCAGQLALHMALTVHGCGTSVTSPSDQTQESCPKPLGPKLANPPAPRRQDAREQLRLDVGRRPLPQRVWFDRSKVFRVHASVRTTIRVHRAVICIYHATCVHHEANVHCFNPNGVAGHACTFARLVLFFCYRKKSKDYITFFFITANNFCVRKKGGMSCRTAFNLSPMCVIFEKVAYSFGTRYSGRISATSTMHVY